MCVNVCVDGMMITMMMRMIMVAKMDQVARNHMHNPNPKAAQNG